MLSQAKYSNAVNFFPAEVKLWFLASTGDNSFTNRGPAFVVATRERTIGLLSVIVRFRVCAQVFRCLHKMAPEYLSPYCQPSPASLAVATCDWLTVVISISHVWNLLRTEDVHLHTPALWIETHFLLTLETVFLFHLLSTTSKPFSSLSTRLAHAARLGFFYKKRAI